MAAAIARPTGARKAAAPLLGDAEAAAALPDAEAEVELLDEETEAGEAALTPVGEPVGAAPPFLAASAATWASTSFCCSAVNVPFMLESLGSVMRPRSCKSRFARLARLTQKWPRTECMPGH